MYQSELKRNGLKLEKNKYQPTSLAPARPLYKGWNKTLMDAHVVFCNKRSSLLIPSMRLQLLDCEIICKMAFSPEALCVGISGGECHFIVQAY